MSMVPWSPPWTSFDQVGDDLYDDEDDDDANINKTMDLPEDWPLGSAVLQYPQQSQSNC